MKNAHPDALKPRKTPRQTRSAATVEAIFQATIQVLLTEGTRRSTTTRVAERAGVSVGTMYQYFPHKRSLLYAVLQQHLEAVADAVEMACRHYEGQPVAIMADGLVTAYLNAKTAHIETSRALYLVASELDTADLMGEIAQRINDAMTRLLRTATDATFTDLAAVTFALRATLAGTVRVVLERGATPSMLQMLRAELPSMCRAYLLTASQHG